MKLYLYDFDGTIYDGDSSVDFFRFCLKKKPGMFKLLFKIGFKYIQYKSKYISDTELKEYIFSFVKYFDNIDELVKEFWLSNKKKIKSFYMNKDHSKDIIISASPLFLLEPICKELKVYDLFASDVDKSSGHFLKPNNRGEEKVKAFYKKYPDAEICEMYSDSMNDKPLLDIALKSYFVRKNKIYDYETYKPGLLKRFWLWGWGIYHEKEELWNYLIVGGLTTLISILAYALCAKGFGLDYILSNVISWIFAVLFAYFANRWFVFRSRNKEVLKEFISFTGSRLLTLLIDTGLMALFIHVFKMDDLIAKIIIQFIIIVLNYIISKLIVFK